MRNLPSAETGTAIPAWQAENLTLLLEECGGIVEELDDAERRSLTQLAGFDRETVENICSVIETVRMAGYDNGQSSLWQCHCERCELHYWHHWHLERIRTDPTVEPDFNLWMIAMNGSIRELAEAQS